MTRNAKPGLPRAVDGPMGAPHQFLGDSVRHARKKVQIALYLAVFVTRDRERYVVQNNERYLAFSPAVSQAFLEDTRIAVQFFRLTFSCITFGICLTFVPFHL